MATAIVCLTVAAMVVVVVAWRSTSSRPRQQHATVAKREATHAKAVHPKSTHTRPPIKTDRPAQQHGLSRVEKPSTDEADDGWVLVDLDATGRVRRLEKPLEKPGGPRVENAGLGTPEVIKAATFASEDERECIRDVVAQDRADRDRIIRDLLAEFGDDPSVEIEAFGNFVGVCRYASLARRRDDVSRSEFMTAGGHIGHRPVAGWTLANVHVEKTLAERPIVSAAEGEVTTCKFVHASAQEADVEMWTMKALTADRRHEMVRAVVRTPFKTEAKLLSPDGVRVTGTSHILTGRAADCEVCAWPTQDGQWAVFRSEGSPAARELLHAYLRSLPSVLPKDFKVDRVAWLRREVASRTQRIQEVHESQNDRGVIAREVRCLNEYLFIPSAMLEALTSDDFSTRGSAVSAFLVWWNTNSPHLKWDDPNHMADFEHAQQLPAP